MNTDGTQMGNEAKELALDCCVLNRGHGAWAFATIATQLATAIGIEVAEVPRRFNYVLHVEEAFPLASVNSFVPIEAIELAADKRSLARVFRQHGVPIPRTELSDSFDAVQALLRASPELEWCLKYPTSCGANGHRMIQANSSEPLNWPRPFVVQEFVRLPQPEVYRTYCAGGELFGWVARRFPVGARPSPWVAHARGARYVILEHRPEAASLVARQALQATGLWSSFGCVDLLCRSDGTWVALEVGTDGLYNHVDRDLGDERIERELQRFIAKAFWQVALCQVRTSSVSICG